MEITMQSYCHSSAAVQTNVTVLTLNKSQSFKIMQLIRNEPKKKRKKKDEHIHCVLVLWVKVSHL